MPSVFTFFDNSSAAPSPVDPPTVSPFDQQRSRWSDSTMATMGTLKPNLSARRSVPDLRVSVISTDSVSTIETDDSDDYPPTVPPKSPSIPSYYHNPRHSRLGEATMTSQHPQSLLRANTLSRNSKATTTSSGQSPTYPSGVISYYKAGPIDISTHLPPPSRQSEIPPWAADTDATSISSTFLSPGLTEDSPSLASTRFSPRTPSPQLLHSQHKRGGVVLPSRLFTDTPELTPNLPSNHLSPGTAKRQRATSAPNPLDENTSTYFDDSRSPIDTKEPDAYFSFYQAQMQKGRERRDVRSLPHGPAGKKCESRKWWDGVKGFFSRRGSEEGAADEVRVRHWTDE
ncbi:MAG: hypothetical protein Q9162_007733 [Coniocarpon cinnabarinum]